MHRTLRTTALTAALLTLLAGPAAAVELEFDAGRSGASSSGEVAPQPVELVLQPDVVAATTEPSSAETPAPSGSPAPTDVPATLLPVPTATETPAPAQTAEPAATAAPAASPLPTAPSPQPSSTAPVGPPPGDPTTGAALGRRVSQALSAAGVTTVAAAVDVEGYGSVLRRDAGHALPPASTQKSYTALALLEAAGRQARFRTEVAAATTAVRGRLAGHLWLVAGGDPYLTDAGLRALARDVRAAGITTVAGDLRLDDSRYDARRTAVGWKRSYMPGQAGPLSAMAVDGNRWRRDRAFLADPALPAAHRFRAHLKAEGVTVLGTVRRERRPAAAAPVAFRLSGPLELVVRRAVKSSDNFASELLLKELGRVVRGNGSSAGGIAAGHDVLRGLGVSAGGGRDGSGLSARNRQSPAGQVAMLRAAQRSDSGPAFRAALPVGCKDGTLRRRFCGTAAAGRVAAKTGTLAGVRALAGYTTTASGRRVWFAFQLTGVRDGGRALRAMDRAVVVLASSTA